MRSESGSLTPIEGDSPALGDYPSPRWYGGFLSPKPPIFREAYCQHEGVNYCDLDFSDILAFADWQGVAYPNTWDEAALSGLIESKDRN